MSKKKPTTLRTSGREQRTALTSPLRLEILGLFTDQEPLAIADMARLMGRSAGSLYHHVGILEKARLLLRAGTRPKGKRHEALFLPAAARIELEAKSDDEDSLGHVTKAMASAFRMAERDLEAALHTGSYRTTGPDRDLFATRMHLRASPALLTKINKHLEAIMDLVQKSAAQPSRTSPQDQHLSLTFALLPLKGRGRDSTSKGE